MGEGKRVWPFLRVMMKRVEQMVSPTVLTFDPLLIPLITDSSYRDLSSVAVIASSVPLSVPLFRNQPQEIVRHAHTPMYIPLQNTLEKLYYQQKLSWYTVHYILWYNLRLSLSLCSAVLQREEEGEPADMASSIKALALSVQNTGVFGDLPRPRVNSASRYKQHQFSVGLSAGTVIAQLYLCVCQSSIHNLLQLVPTHCEHLQQEVLPFCMCIYVCQSHLYIHYNFHRWPTHQPAVAQWFARCVLSSTLRVRTHVFSFFFHNYINILSTETLL